MDTPSKPLLQCDNMQPIITVDNAVALSCKPAWGGAGIVPTLKDTTPRRAAWGPTAATVPTHSFRDLQSEDLAKEINQKEIDKIEQQFKEQDPDPCIEDLQEQLPEPITDGAQDTTDNDYLLAQMLQYEFDLQHDHQLELDQRQINKNSKLSISYSNRKVLPTFATETREGPPAHDEPIDEIEAGEMDEPVMPACGYVMQSDGVMVTKHDSAITARRNAKKMMTYLPCEVNTGDAGGFTINMPNKVFNKLNATIQTDNRRKQRVHDKVEKGTLGSHMDEGSSLALLALVNSGALEKLGGVISTGKEAVVYSAAVGGLEEAASYAHCAVKVFKTRLTEFKTRERYIRDDHRFKERFTKTNNFSNITLWVEKEYRNLCRVHSAALPCPAPLYVRNNLLIMSLIGNPSEPAPQIRNVDLSSGMWQMAYDQTIEIVRSMTNDCRLVHADLSEYNLLYDMGQVYVIDFAQAVDISHPSALSYLYRDLCTIATFFRRRGVACVPTGIELLEDITGMDIRDCGGQNTDCDSISSHERVATTEGQLGMWRESQTYDDAVYEFLWGQHTSRMAHTPSLLGKSSSKSGNVHTDEWITRKTDNSITRGQHKKKKRTRRNSASSKTEKTDSKTSISPSRKTDKFEKRTADVLYNGIELRTDADRTTNIAALNNKASDEDADFYIVDSSDCADLQNNPSSKCAEQKISASSMLSDRQSSSDCGPTKSSDGPRVRFNVDEDTVDTEDYNADADTDDPEEDACSNEAGDADTDVPVTDQDGDTEGYHGDADDTDNYASDRNDPALVMPCKRISNQKHRRPHLDSSANATQKNSAKTCQLAEGMENMSVGVSKPSTPDKRTQKKKNKKGRTKSQQAL